ncbi:copper amine oxidase N-terminal domain-containing protein [Paenibacillus favisporus]|uniref:copper amine oxidase N-terminal domain-containing protein n=1 Tax=Paenibacillus favisporus TaxID=221028 RepID=UPI003D2B1430
MKKLVMILLACVLGISVITNGQKAEASGETESELPTIELKDKGVILSGQTMLPIGQLFKELGLQLQFDPKQGSIGYTIGDIKVTAKLNVKSVSINGAKKLYTVPPQLIEGKLMLPLRMITDTLNAKTTIDYTRPINEKTKPISYVMLTTSAKKVIIFINNAYETYKKYIGKTVWIHSYRVQMKLTELDGTPTKSVHNLSQVKIIKIESDELITGWVDVYFTYQNKTYKIKSLHTEDFQKVISTVNPYKTFDFPSSYWKLIENSQVRVGMTGKMLELSWDKPDRILNSGNHTVTWIYDIAPPKLFIYVTLKNGAVTSYSLEEK